MEWIDFSMALTEVIFGAIFIRRVVWLANGRSLDVVFRFTDIEGIIMGILAVAIFFESAITARLLNDRIFLGAAAVWFTIQVLRFVTRVWKTRSSKKSPTFQDAPSESN